jgi:hypothetical protein
LVCLCAAAAGRVRRRIRRQALRPISRAHST